MCNSRLYEQASTRLFVYLFVLAINLPDIAQQCCSFMGPSDLIKKKLEMLVQHLSMSHKAFCLAASIKRTYMFET